GATPTRTTLCRSPGRGRTCCRTGIRTTDYMTLKRGANVTRGRTTVNRFLTALGVTVFAAAGVALLVCTGAARPEDSPPEGSRDLLAELKTYRHKIVYESNRDGNWELYLCNADGSDPVNLTRTTDVDELFPRPSPDGSKICFVADEGKG